MLWACGLSSGLNPAVHSHVALFGLGFPLLLLLNIAFIFFWLVFSIRYVWLPFVGMLLSVSYISLIPQHYNLTLFISSCLFPIYMTIVR
mgnify:CR=1 FL=1